MRLFMLALLLLALLADAAFADSYTYDQRTGYYYDTAGNAYIRNCVWTDGMAGYWYCGRYYAGKPGYWTCSYYPAKLPVALKGNGYLDANWRSRMLELAAQKIEQQAFLDSAKALGLTVADPEGALYSRFAPSGATIYGTSFQALQQAWGLDQTAENMAQSYRLAEQALAAGDKGREGHQLLVGQTAAARERIAAILAKATVASDILKAIEGVGQRTDTKGFSWRIEPNPGGGLRVERQDDAVSPAIRAEFAAKWKVLAIERCAACHTGKEAKGGFAVVDSYQALSISEKVKVWERLVTSDDGRLMPRLPNGKPGKKLTMSELQLFLVN